jgi:chaperonin GroES
MKPVRNQILVKPEEIENKTSSGLLLLEDSKLPVGEVVGVGSLVEEIAPGDRIVYSKYAGQEIDDYILIGDDAVYAILQ